MPWKVWTVFNCVIELQWLAKQRACIKQASRNHLRIDIMWDWLLFVPGCAWIVHLSTLNGVLKFSKTVLTHICDFCEVHRLPHFRNQVKKYLGRMWHSRVLRDNVNPYSKPKHEAALCQIEKNSIRQDRYLDSNSYLIDRGIVDMCAQASSGVNSVIILVWQHFSHQKNNVLHTS